MSQSIKRKSKVELLLELSDYLRTVEQEKKKRSEREWSVDSFSEDADAFLLHAPMLLGTYTRNELRDCFGRSAHEEARQSGSQHAEDKEVSQGTEQVGSFFGSLLSAVAA